MMVTVDGDYCWCWCSIRWCCYCPCPCYTTHASSAAVVVAVPKHCGLNDCCWLTCCVHGGSIVVQAINFFPNALFSISIFPLFCKKANAKTSCSWTKLALPTKSKGKDLLIQPNWSKPESWPTRTKQRQGLLDPTQGDPWSKLAWWPCEQKAKIQE